MPNQIQIYTDTTLVCLDMEDPLRHFSKQEHFQLAQCRCEISPSTRSLFYDLVTLRTDKNGFIASKKFLLKFLSIGSHNTLNKGLKELETVNLICITKTYIKVCKQFEVQNRFSFPCLDNDVSTFNNENENLDALSTPTI